MQENESSFLRQQESDIEKLSIGNGNVLSGVFKCGASASADIGKPAEGPSAEGGLLDLDDLLGGPSPSLPVQPTLELDPTVEIIF